MKGGQRPPPPHCHFQEGPVAPHRGRPTGSEGAVRCCRGWWRGAPTPDRATRPSDKHLGCDQDGQGPASGTELRLGPTPLHGAPVAPRPLSALAHLPALGGSPSSWRPPQPCHFWGDASHVHLFYETSAPPAHWASLGPGLWVRAVSASALERLRAPCTGFHSPQNPAQAGPRERGSAEEEVGVPRPRAAARSGRASDRREQQAEPGWVFPAAFVHSLTHSSILQIIVGCLWCYRHHLQSVFNKKKRFN